MPAEILFFECIFDKFILRGRVMRKTASLSGYLHSYSALLCGVGHLRPASALPVDGGRLRGGAAATERAAGRARAAATGVLGNRHGRQGW